MTIVTRFAPSPTGVLHTGSARTALFNWLFARQHNGLFKLRIEDTDQARSKPEYTQAILNNLKWLNLNWDGEVIYQLARQDSHYKIAEELIKKGKAYYCYTTEQELADFRAKNPNQKFISPWRHAEDKTAPAGIKPVIRLKVANDGVTEIDDKIMGRITISNNELDDMVLIRSDGIPTYMMAVVVDDHDMDITHIIRGDDHLTNAFRQKQIYQAMDWEVPIFAHIPLIHDKNGKKLSKRAGALGIDEYEKLGYLPQAVINHLLRLGWSHGNEEIISTPDAIKWFSLEAIGKSPARFDIDKLNHINAHYLKQTPNLELIKKISPLLGEGISESALQRITQGMESLKLRAATLNELAEASRIYIERKSPMDAKAHEILQKVEPKTITELVELLKDVGLTWDKDSLHHSCEQFAALRQLKPAIIMQTLRALTLGTFNAPGIFEVMVILGKEECLKRINATLEEI